jgi:hypothetical protein
VRIKGEGEGGGVIPDIIEEEFGISRVAEGWEPKVISDGKVSEVCELWALIG